MYDVDLNLDKWILANVRDGAGKEALPINGNRSTVCGAHLINHIGEVLMEYIKEADSRTIEEIKCNPFEIDSGIRRILFAGDGNINQHYYAYYKVNKNLFNTCKYFILEHKARIYHRFSRYHLVPYTISSMVNGKWHKTGMERLKLIKWNGIISRCVPHLLACLLQYQCLFGPLQPATTSQTNAYEGITNLFTAKTFLENNIIGHDCYHPQCVLFTLGLNNILNTGCVENDWYRCIDEIYNIPDPQNRDQLINDIINGNYDGELHWRPATNLSNQNSRKTKADKIYHKNLRFEIAAALILRNNELAILILDDILNRFELNQQLAELNPLVFLFLSVKKCYNVTIEELLEILDQVLNWFIESVPHWLKKWDLLRTVGNWKCQEDVDKDKWWLEQVPFTTDMVESLNQIFNIAHGLHKYRQHWDVSNQCTYRLLLQQTPTHGKENLVKHCANVNQHQQLKQIHSRNSQVYKEINKAFIEKEEKEEDQYDKNYISDYKHNLKYIKFFILRGKKNEDKIKLAVKLKRHIDHCIYKVYGGELSKEQNREIKKCLKRKHNQKVQFTVPQHLRHFKYLVTVLKSKFIPTKQQLETIKENNSISMT